MMDSYIPKATFSFGLQREPNLPLNAGSSFNTFGQKGRSLRYEQATNNWRTGLIEIYPSFSSKYDYAFPSRVRKEVKW